MSATPTEQALNWAAGAIGTGAKVVAVQSLHDGYSPWLLRIEHEGRTHEALLRALVGGRAVLPFQIATGAAALRVAEQHGLNAPRLIASDVDGRATGAPATLETVVRGSSTSPSTVTPERLHAAGAAIAKVHQIPLEPQADLPLRVRSLQGPSRLDEWALQRRWSALYQATRDAAKSEVVAEFCALTGWSASHARPVLANTHSTPLLQRGDDTLRALPFPQGPTVFVHADLWAGNMMWDGDTSVTLIDWKDSGVGQAGVDLGHLRMTMAIQYGPDAATHVLDGWQQEAGREAADVPYWDLVSAVHTPTELNDHEPVFDDTGKQLDSTATTQRRDVFLRNALDQLDPGIERIAYLDPTSE